MLVVPCLREACGPLEATRQCWRAAFGWKLGPSFSTIFIICFVWNDVLANCVVGCAATGNRRGAVFDLPRASSSTGDVARAEAEPAFAIEPKQSSTSLSEAR